MRNKVSEVNEGHIGVNSFLHRNSGEMLSFLTKQAIYI